MPSIMNNLATRFLRRDTHTMAHYTSVDSGIDSEKSSIEESEESPLQGGEPQARRRATKLPKNGCLLILSSLLTLFLAIALTILTTLHLRLVRETTPPKRLHCGNSIAEAKARGCSFDILSKSWLPPACPRYGEREFVAQSTLLNNGTPWQYWEGPEDDSPEISWESMSTRIENRPGERWSWAGTDREHMAHCAWLIIRLAHAMDVGDRVDVLTANFVHTKHCTLMMLDRAMSAPGLDERITRGDVIFSSC